MLIKMNDEFLIFSIKDVEKSKGTAPSSKWQYLSHGSNRPAPCLWIKA